MTPADTNDEDLTRLLAVIESGHIRRTHQWRLRLHKCKPAWFAMPRSRRSFQAVFELSRLCTTERLLMLVRHQRIGRRNLIRFVQRTRLSEAHRAIFERAIRLLEEQMPAWRASELRAADSTGTGVTGELQQIIAEEQARTSGSAARRPSPRKRQPGREALTRA